VPWPITISRIILNELRPGRAKLLVAEGKAPSEPGLPVALPDNVIPPKFSLGLLHAERTGASPIFCLTRSMTVHIVIETNR
jgi:hypothetical protein